MAFLDTLSKMVKTPSEAKEQSFQDELRLFREKEKIKQEYSETAASIDKLGELFKTLGLEEKSGTSLAGIDNDNMKTAIMRGVIKKQTGIELPQTEEERKNELRQKAEEKMVVTEAGKKAELKAKLDDFMNEYDSFNQVNAVIQPFRSTGGLANRVKTFSNLKLAGLQSNTPLGNAVSTYDDITKRLRVSIARLKDVGNLSVVEQMAAQAIIPALGDSQSAASLKDAYLKDIGEAALKDEKVEQGKKTNVKQVLGKWMKTDIWKNQVTDLWDKMPASERIRRTFNDIDTAEKSDVPSGTLIMVNDRLAIKE